ncbi:uncharacterized protein EV422DRAFT_499624 [Fimicolochytrium jonesii]|uniref:uncharacterized protein n=1 Tax=Fimicolochytrium jonesii TaxID=1396493 RepID=UPI0022FEE724|nr:uncharacterized protein EV422DRAFT_499624 [Fimicolochytrium jonesii]KAI8817783.1 hypothetical protein EV422DRAFT_499624 [Fimicolochytrium jonesii]
MYYDCPICDRCFRTSSSLYQHQWATHFPCTVCARVFSTPQSLHQHSRAMHVKCAWWEEYFWSDSDYSDHLHQYHSTCEYCNNVCQDDDALARHIEEEHPSCADCGRTFRREQDFDQHVNSGIHTQRTVDCNYCGESFRTFSGLTQHIESGNCEVMPMTRKQIKNIVRVCERATGLPGTILQPRITYGDHPSLPEKATSRSWNGSGYACCVCNRSFPQLSQLNEHLITHEPDHYPCINCRRRFKVLSALLQHWELTHCGQSAAKNATRIFRRQIPDCF